jgi:hypothetical protein
MFVAQVEVAVIWKVHNSPTAHCGWLLSAERLSIGKTAAHFSCVLVKA